MKERKNNYRAKTCCSLIFKNTSKLSISFIRNKNIICHDCNGNSVGNMQCFPGTEKYQNLELE